MTRSPCSTDSSLRAKRLRQNKTQAQFAADIGCSASYYALLEREPRLIRHQMAARIAATLGVSVEEILP